MLKHKNVHYNMRMAHRLSRGTSGEKLKAVSLSWLLQRRGERCAVPGRRGAEVMEKGFWKREAFGMGRVSGTAVYQGPSPQAHGPVINRSTGAYQAVF